MKKSFYFLGALVVIIVAVVFLVASNLDAIVKKSIEKYGSQATKTAVQVSSVKIKIKDGVGSIGGLRVSNPKGFSSPAAISLGNITIDIDTSTVTKDPVIIEKIHVSEPHLTYEINKSGKSNVDGLKSNLGSDRSGAKSSSETSSGKEKKIIIRDLVIEKGKVDVLVAALGNKANTTNLPTIHLKNLGGKGGSTPSEIALQIIRPLSNRVSKAAMNTGIQQYLGKNAADVQKMLKKGAMDKLGTSGKGLPGEAGGALKKLLGK
jgi:hypothetical protein